MKKMIVTGASTGVGHATAKLFAGKGYTVFALARSEDKLRQLEEETGGKVRACPCNVADKTRVKEVFESIISEHGAPDVLVNNAGVTAGGHEADLDWIDRIIDTNLKATMYCTYAALPSMKENGGGDIINVASIAGAYIGHGGNDGLYAASKHGQVAFGDSLGRFVREDNIRITNLCPGGIDTPLWNDSNPYPLGQQNMIKPEEVADLIRYVLEQPKRTLFKNVIFVPMVEPW